MLHRWRCHGRIYSDRRPPMKQKTSIPADCTCPRTPAMIAKSLRLVSLGVAAAREQHAHVPRAQCSFWPVPQCRLQGCILLAEHNPQPGCRSFPRKPRRGFTLGGDPRRLLPRGRGIGHAACCRVLRHFVTKYSCSTSLLHSSTPLLDLQTTLVFFFLI